MSYSFREVILRARLSLMRASRSVRIRKSFWIFAARPKPREAWEDQLLWRRAVAACCARAWYCAHPFPPRPWRSTDSPPHASRADPQCLYAINTDRRVSITTATRQAAQQEFLPRWELQHTFDKLVVVVLQRRSLLRHRGSEHLHSAPEAIRTVGEGQETTG